MAKRGLVVAILSLPHIGALAWLLLSDQTLVPAILAPSHYHSLFDVVFSWGLLLIALSVRSALGVFALRTKSLAVATCAVSVMGIAYPVCAFVFAFVGLWLGIR